MKNNIGILQRKYFTLGKISMTTLYIIEKLKVSLVCYINKNKILKYNDAEIVEKYIEDLS